MSKVIEIEGWGIPESKRPPRKQNRFCEYHTCKHCGKRIGHRPYTRDWEHVAKAFCEKPWPRTAHCYCKECE